MDTGTDILVLSLTSVGRCLVKNYFRHFHNNQYGRNLIIFILFYFIILLPPPHIYRCALFMDIREGFCFTSQTCHKWLPIYLLLILFVYISNIMLCPILLSTNSTPHPLPFLSKRVRLPLCLTLLSLPFSEASSFHKTTQSKHLFLIKQSFTKWPY